MHCPYCRNPLEPIHQNGRPTSASQCVQCGGSWLQFSQASAPGSIQGGASTALTLTGQSGTLLPSPWSPTQSTRPGGPGPGPLGMAQPVFPEPHRARPSRLKQWWSGGQQQDPRASAAPDWDLCTWCQQPHPGSGPTCRHCNVERMRCPHCRCLMVGVRKLGIMVELCPLCQGLFFEKGRLEQLMDAIKSGEPAGQAALPGGTAAGGPSLIAQLAALLEDTEPDPLTGVGEEGRGVLRTMASAVGTGLGGSKKVLYDLLVLVGDLQNSKKPGS